MTRGCSSACPAPIRRLDLWIGGLLATVSALVWALPAVANPDGGVVVGGAATITQTAPNTLTIKQTTDKAIINWRNFSIGAGEHTKFVMPSAASAVLNRVTSGQVSQILGRLSANGKVFLINPNGVVFGNGSQVDVGALITSTHDIKNQDFLADTLRFTLAGRANAKIINQGTISVREGGLVALVAPSIENSGVIYARLGRVVLAAGNAVTIDPYGDDLITFEVPEGVAQDWIDPQQNPLAGLIDLSGDIIADGGGVLITVDHARAAIDQAINMTGYVQARSLETSGGTVVLDGGRGDITVAGSIDVSGIGRATGGEVRVVTDGNLKTTAASQIIASGGADGGDGGFAAVSAWASRELAGRISVKAGTETAANGWLYTGDNTAAARSIRNPNAEGAGTVGGGANTILFEANKGQTDAAVDFLSRTQDATLFLSAADAVLAVQGQGGTTQALTTVLAGSNTSVTAVGEDKQAGVVNSYVGSDPSQWVEGAETYKQVRYANVYDGVDLVYYGNKAGNLEYDLVVAAGADAGQIALNYSGAEAITKTAQGDLNIDLAGGQQVVQKAPLVYQKTADARVLVPGEYVVGTDGAVTMKLDAYDTTKQLVVDPVINFSTYLGGNGNEIALNAPPDSGLASDAAGGLYVTGSTASTNFPTVSAAQTDQGASDAFVSKFDVDGNLIYSTYLGGGGSDSAYGIAADGLGNAYVVGGTASADFPTLNAAQAAINGVDDAFVTKLNNLGALSYSTYLGGSTAGELASAVAVDGSGNAYVTGQTNSADFTTSGAAQGANGGGQDGFLTKYTAAGAISYSTYLGGSGADQGFGVAVNSGGEAYVTGSTASADFTTASAVQGALSGAQDAFVTKYTAAGAISYSTYFGGSGTENGRAIAVDGSGNAYFTGSTLSADYPTLNAAQSTLNGAQDAYLTKLSATGTTVYSTYLGGGSNAEQGEAVVVDGSNKAYVVGETDSSDFPTRLSVQSTYGGVKDAFATVFDSSGAVAFSTFLGGSTTENGYGVALTGGETFAVAGETFSADFTVANAYQGTAPSGNDAFLTRFSIADIFATPSNLAQQTQQAQFIGRAGLPPPEDGGGALPVVVIVDPAIGGIAGPATGGAIGGLGGSARIEAAVNRLTDGGFDGGLAFLQGGDNYSFAEQRTVFNNIETTTLLNSLSDSVDITAQRAQVQLAAVAEGLGPSLTEFTTWLDANNVETGRSQTYVAMYLRMAESFERRGFAEALTGATAPSPIELADASPNSDLGALLSGTVDSPFQLTASADQAPVLTAALQDGAEIAEVFVGEQRVVVDTDGRFQVLMTPNTVINEDVSITIVHADGSVSERPLFVEAEPGSSVFSDTAVLGRAADGSVTGNGRLRDPGSISQVLVNGEPAAVATDGTVSFDNVGNATASQDYATLVVTRNDGSSERSLIAVTDTAPIIDAVIAADAAGNLTGSAKLGNAEAVSTVLVDGEPVVVGANGSFSFPLSQASPTINRNASITIIYENGARAEQKLSLDRRVPVEQLDTYRTAGGLRMVEGRIAANAGVAELRIGNQTVPVAADGSFVASVAASAETANGFVPMSAEFGDGAMAAEEIAATPVAVITDLESRRAEDGSEITDGRIANPETVAELRLGDQPILFTDEGRFSLSKSSSAINQPLAMTVVYRDGSTRAQRLRGRGATTTVTELTPVRTKDGRKVTGRLANPADVAQVWVDGARLPIDANGGFSLVFGETSFNAVESLDMTFVFNDGSRLDQAMALRATPPIQMFRATVNAVGQPVVSGRLENPADVAEVLIGGRPVPVGENGAFSVAVAETGLDASRSVGVSIIHRDGSRTERRVATERRAVFAEFRPALGATGALAIENGTLRAAGALAEPEKVAALEIGGKQIPIAADGSFLVEIPKPEINANDSVNIATIYKDGTRADEQLALVSSPLLGDLATVIAEDGTSQVLGRLDDTDGVAGVLVDGRPVSIDDEGQFRFAADVGTATGQTQAAARVSVTVLYDHGRRAEKQMAVDAQPVFAKTDTVVADDGGLAITATIADRDNVATVLVDGAPVELTADGELKVRLQQTAINIDRSLPITVIYEDGTRRMQQIAVAVVSPFETVTTRRNGDGRPVLAGVLEDADNVASLRIGGRDVAITEDGRFEATLVRAPTTVSGSVDVTIIYKNGARAERKIALKETPSVGTGDLVTTVDGGALASWSIANPEAVAEVRINGRPVPIAADGGIDIRLSKSQINDTENVSITTIYKDGSRIEQQAGLSQRSAVSEIAAAAVTNSGAVIEGRIGDMASVQSVRVDGAPLAVNGDGSFRLDLATGSRSSNRSVPMTVTYANGSRKTERLGVTAANMFQSFEAVTTVAGATLAEGRVAEPGQVARVLVDGRTVALNADGSFALDVSNAALNISRDVPVTIVYKDGARVSRQVALRTDSVVRDINSVVGVDGREVVSGKLAGAGRIAQVTLGGQPVSLTADGSFEATLASAADRRLQIVYADGSRQAKTFNLRRGTTFAGIDTYAAADGTSVIEGRIANARQVAALFIDGQRVRVTENGGFVFRNNSVNVTKSSLASMRVVYKNGAIAGRRVAISTTANRPVMLVNNVTQTPAGVTVTEALIGNAAEVAGLEINGRTYDVGADGRVSYTLPTQSVTAGSQVAVRVVYNNGLDAETWLPASRVAGGLIPLPRAPRKVALVIGNSRYSSGIRPVATAAADANLIGNMFANQFGFESRVLANASENQVLSMMRRLSRELGANDQLVMHYAGAGITDRGTGQGYWLPGDARATSTNKWISTDQVYRALQDMGLRQAMVLADSGFTVSRSSRTLDVPTTRTTTGRPVQRTPVSVIASGLGRPVRAVPGDPHSSFTWRLTSALSGIDTGVAATDLFGVIRDRLTNRRPPVGQTAALNLSPENPAPAF